MGFSDYSRVITENNRRLQRSIRTKYFKKSATDSTDNKRFEHKEDRHDYSEAIKNRKLRALKLIGITGLIGVVLVYFSYKFIDRPMDDWFHSSKQHGEGLRVIEDQKESANAYQYFVSSGDVKFEAGQIERARYDYQMAKKVNQSGKKANLGLTLCLLSDCKTEQINCERANEYFDLMMSSNTLTKVEIEKLNSYKKSK